MRNHLVLTTIVILSTALAARGDELGKVLQRISAARPQAANSPELRASWDKLVRQGPVALPRILEALDTTDTAAANWLLTAYDRIAERDFKQGGKGIPRDALVAFASDARHQGRARRLALDTAERLQPGTRDKLVRPWISDPEFGFDAINLALASAGSLNKTEAATFYRKLLTAATDIGQARTIAGKLKELGTNVSLAETFGFPREWYLIGPFAGAGSRSFAMGYPPETKVDLLAEHPGKDGKVIRWKRVDIPEHPGGNYPVSVNLYKELGQVDDCVGYAYTVLDAPTARDVEIRAAADDNLSVWVNGSKVFAFEEWRNGMRLDRHRFKAHLRAGRNTVLVKVCQGKSDANTPDTTWELVFRVCDEAGRGVPFRVELPRPK